MEKNIELLNVIYQNAEMGIIGIVDVLRKIRNPKLLEELISEKKEYQKFLKETKKLLKKENGECKQVSLMAKIGTEIYSEMKLMKNTSDKLIIKMMIEGSYKSIGILTTKQMEYTQCSKTIKTLLKSFIDILNKNIDSLKNLDKIC